MKYNTHMSYIPLEIGEVYEYFHYKFTITKIDKMVSFTRFEGPDDNELVYGALDYCAFFMYCTHLPYYKALSL